MLETIITIVGTGLLGVFAWAFLLQSRVSVLEADRITIRELINIHLGAIQTQLSDVKSRLDKIDTKLDKEQ